MKRLLKILVLAFSLVLLFTACFSLTACSKNDKSLEVKLAVYNVNDAKYEEKTLKVKLCNDVAPKTVKAIIEAVKGGYYDNAVFYKDTSLSSQIMLGELKADGSDIKKQADLETIVGEFDLNGFKNNNLTNKKGIIGLWHSWTANSSYTTNNIGVDSGSAVMYIPTTSISSYNGYFALFAKVDLDDAKNSESFNAIIDAFNNDEDLESYDIFYTGESADDLTEYIIKTNDLKEDPDYDEAENTYKGVKIFEAEGSDLVSLNRRTVKVPELKDGARAVYVKSVKVI